MITKKPRGFAAMSPALRAELSARGGRAVAAGDRSFSKDRAQAVAAGKKGGKSVDPANRSFTRDPKLAARAGRKSGKARSHQQKKD